MDKDQLFKIANAMVAKGKGILAADESSGTIQKRFDAIGVESTDSNRRDYREMLFRANNAMKNNIAGVILYDETIRQNAKDGTPLVKLIEQAGSLPGIKVDKGTKPLPFCPGELITEGLDGLGERMDEYRKIGARFAKWRAVIDIGPGIPTHTAIDRCYDITEWVLKTAFQDLYHQRVMLEGMVLKPNMVISGKKAPKRASPEKVAEKTLRVLKECVPPAVAGIAFLSGGQSDEEATAHLDLINRLGPLPWPVTFSYGRALQHEPQNVWAGKSENVAAAQRAFSHRARMNGLAAQGQWKADLEKAA